MPLNDLAKMLAAQQIEEMHNEVRIADARLRVITTMVGINIGLTAGILVFILTL